MLVLIIQQVIDRHGGARHPSMPALFVTQVKSCRFYVMEKRVITTAPPLLSALHVGNTAAHSGGASFYHMCTFDTGNQCSLNHAQFCMLEA